MHMYDASTKVPSSIMAGNIQHLGNFDQCVAVRVADADSGADVFRGKHCTASVSFVMPTGPRRGEPGVGDLLLAAANASGVAPGATSATMDWAYCVPSSCSAGDLELALRARLGALAAGGATPLVSVADGRCLAADGGPQSRPLRRGDIAFICLLVVSVYVVAASTVYDLLADRAAGPAAAGLRPWLQLPGPAKGPAGPRPALLKAFAAFSLRRNGAALLSTARTADTMACVHGLRVLSIAWVVLLHCFYNEAVAPNINRAVVAKLGDSWANMVLMNATLATDTFFLLSGLLLALSFLRRGAAAFSPLSLLAFYWHRYVRLTPVYAVVVWFYASMLARLGGGPLWERVIGPETDNCVANWWTNLAYVNNFVELAAPCMNQTWYLAVDMQLFWLSPLVLLPLARWPRPGRALLLALLVASVAAPFAVTVTEGLSGAMLYTLDQSMLGRVFVLVYTRVYHRAGPYLLGLGLGCVLASRPPAGEAGEAGEADCKPGLSPCWSAGWAVGWAASAATCLAVLFGVAGFYQRGRAYSALEAGLYAGLHRTAWAAGVAWVVFACVSGRGGAVNTFLSWRPFAPLARLSYCVYLSHYAVILVGHGLRRAPGYFSVFATVQAALGTLAISFAVAVVLSLTYEMPFMVLDRVLLPRGPSARTPPSAATACSAAAAEAGLPSREADRPGQPDLRGYDNAAFDKLAEK